jgi:hypothetical protein
MTAAVKIPVRAKPCLNRAMDTPGDIASIAHGKSIDQLVDGINQNWRGMVSSIVKVGQLVRELRAQTDHGEWALTVAERLPFGERTALQLIAIASHPVLADPKRASDLPAKWSLLAELSRLDAPVLEKAIRTGAISARTGRDDIRALIKPKRPPADTSVVPSYAEAAPPVIAEDKDHTYRVAAMIAGICGVTVEDVFAETRHSNRSTLARQLTAYALQTNNDWDATRTGRAMNRDRTTVSHSCKVIEDLRDNPLVDDWVEGVMATVCKAQELSDERPEGLMRAG